MIKNTAGQVVGAQMVSATDGSAFTGSVTVRVTGDGGTQATGSVGSGACTHEGNGYHTYAPAQAETNYDLIAFTFTGTGAIPVTVQVYTITGDAFARLGAPAGASVSADILAIDNLVDDLESRLTSTRAGYLDNLSAGAVATASSLSSLDTKIGTPSNLGGGASVAANLADIEAQTDDIGAAGAGLTAVPWNASWDAEVESEVADALESTIADSVPADGSRPSVKQAVLMITRFLMERSVSSTTVTVRKEDGSTSSMTFTLNDATNPTSITRAS